MSSPANHNLTIAQPVLGGSMNAGPRQQLQQQQQRPSHDQTILTSSQQRHRGRGCRATYRGPHVRQPVNRAPQGDVSHATVTESSTDHSDAGTTSQVASCPPSNQSGDGGDVPRATSSRPHRGGHRPPTRGVSGGGGGSGKYKQRQQLNQLIDGMDGLDIDLIESLAPTNRSNDSSKGRHATVTRKVNLTHLLNYDRRQRGGRHYHGTSFVEGRGSHHHPQTYYRDCNNVHKFNKQQFLQANCQFVVLPFHDYTIHKVNPDWPVDWDCIEEVKFKQTGTTETTCPICLDPPISAKITRCGHIYCWTCMLHYLSLSDKKSRQCPICFEPISESDLRSVVSKSYSNHAVDEEIVMRLMFRTKGCVEIVPYFGAEPSQAPFQADTEEHYDSQANLLIVDPATVINEVAKREQDELLLKLELDRDEPEVCFVEQAMGRLNERIERLQQMSIDPPKFSQRQRDPHQSSEPSTSQKREKSFLFYQSSDGQHIYLNPFSTKLLIHEYGSLESCPLEIRAKVLQMDWISMSESWRKRFKYLEHLPLTCEFRLIEIDFEASNLVGPDTFASFADQIKLRANERAFRKTEELKRDKIIQIEQNRRIYGIQPSLTINLDNMEQFPSVYDDARGVRSKTPNPSEGPDSVGDQNVQAERAPEPEINVEGETIAPNTTLSFKEIQERQEAAEAINSCRSKNNTTGSWAGSAAKSKSAPQSSFAKLLVDAKSSQKQWTRSKQSTEAGQSSAPAVSAQSREQFMPGTSLDLDDGGEELRAPPSRFTIGDFLESTRPAKRSGKRNQ